MYKWEAKCKPYVNFLQSDPRLQWFVETRRVAQVGAQTHASIRSQYPDLHGDPFLVKMYTIWFDMVHAFAINNGYREE